MGREIRRVPANWKHPKYWQEDQNGRTLREAPDLRPMHQSSYEDAVKEFEESAKEWAKECREWQEGKAPGDRTVKQCMQDILDAIYDERRKMVNEQGYEVWNANQYREDEVKRLRSGIYNYSDYAGNPPRYPNPEDYMPKGDWWQLFEDVSEGTPLSPPFQTKEELVDWLTKNDDFWGVRWSKEAAEDIINCGSLPSGILSSNGLYFTPENQYKLRLDKLN